jgi:hypothetical protein
MDESVVKHFEQPAKLDRPAQLLMRAADLIEEHGHCQTGEGISGESMCVMVALRRAWAASSIDSRPYLAAMQRIERRVPNVRAPGNGNLVRLARWSDATPTAEVLATLRAVALSGVE